MGKAVVAECMGHTLTAKREQYLSEIGIDVTIEPPLDSVQIETLMQQWTGAHIDQQQDHTRLFITESNAQQRFGDEVIIMSDIEIGAKLVELTVREGHIDGK